MSSVVRTRFYFNKALLSTALKCVEEQHGMSFLICSHWTY